MTGATVLDNFLVLMDKKSTDTSYRALALIWLDLVLKDIQNRQDSFHWRFLEVIGTTFSTAVDDFDYALSTIAPSIDTQKVIHVYDKTNDRTYRYIPYERFKDIVADESNNEGVPYIFSIGGDNLLLWPRPSAIVTNYIDYVKVIGDAADDSVTILVPDKFKKVVIDGMMEFGFKFDPELGNAVNQNAIYESGIDRMRKENSQMIMENMRPVSHRWKHHRRDLDGREAFPLEKTNY
jgi:hypothetical protein